MLSWTGGSNNDLQTFSKSDSQAHGAVRREVYQEEYQQVSFFKQFEHLAGFLEWSITQARTTGWLRSDLNVHAGTAISKGIVVTWQRFLSPPNQPRLGYLKPANALLTQAKNHPFCASEISGGPPGRRESACVSNLRERTATGVRRVVCNWWT